MCFGTLTSTRLWFHEWACSAEEWYCSMRRSKKKWVCPKVALWHLSGHWPVASLFLATSGLSACSSGRCTEMHHHHHHHHCSRCNSTIHSVVKLHLCVMHIHCCLALYLSCWWYTRTVQRLWVERSSVIKFGISSAGRPQPSDQQSNPYKSQFEPFLGQIHHLHFQNQTQYSCAQKASMSGRNCILESFCRYGRCLQRN